MPRTVMQTVVTTLLMTAVVLAGPKFTSTWKAPDAAGTSFAGKKVAALIISQDQNLRVSGEEALVRELAGIGLPQGVASYRIVPKEELRDPDKARGWYERSGIGGVVSMRLLKADTRQTWTPSTWTSPYYSSFWSYYGYGWGSVYDPGYTTTNTFAIVETLVFDVTQNKLLWAGVTESKNPKNPGQVIKDIVTATVKEMKKQGLARSGASR